MDRRVSVHVLERSENTRIGTLTIYAGQDQALADLLQPIPDASYKREQKVSPPPFFPGTRKVVIKIILSWASSYALLQRNHIFYLYGYAGSGKSAIAQAVCEKVGGDSRLLASFFFQLDAGDRSRIGKLPNTLASQVATALPETAPVIQAALNSDPELASAQSKLALGARLEALVYQPFKAVIERRSLSPNSLSPPYLIVIDGLDECEDKEGVKEFLECTLRFFEQEPLIPLRIFITSRSERHIHSSLKRAKGGVLLKDLAEHCSKDDIETFRHDAFDHYIGADRVIQAYVREHGPWPNPSDASKLVDHIGGSFSFASTLFNFIFQPEGPGSPDDQSTPMSRLPFALSIDPEFDTLYSTTLARSEHLPHFLEVISTLALTLNPLPVSGIAELLGLSTHIVLQVLLDLHAIIHLPISDDSDMPVTFCHASLRDFLTSQVRSGRFHASPAFHLRLFFQCFIIGLEQRRQPPLQRGRGAATIAYSMQYEETHWARGMHAFKGHAAIDRIFKLCGKARRRPPSAESHASCLDKLGIKLLGLVNDAEVSFQIEGIISLHREALTLRPLPDGERLATLDNLGIAFCKLFEDTGSTPAVDAAISYFREAHSLRPSPHPDLPISLHNIGIAFYLRFQQSGCVENNDIDDAIGRHSEALNLRSPPDPQRSFSLNALGNAFQARCEHKWSSDQKAAYDDAKEAMRLYREALDLQERPTTLSNLANALRSRGEHSEHVPDFDEAISLLQRALLLLEKRPSAAHRWPFMNIGIAFYSRFTVSSSAEDLDEAISSLHKSLDLIPQLHIYRHKALRYLVLSLQALYDKDKSLISLEEAITHNRELLTKHYPSGSPHRGEWLDKLISLLRMYSDATGSQDHLDEARRLDEELGNLATPRLVGSNALSPVSQT